MRVTFFEWDEGNAGHIARHAVTPEEVEEACLLRPYILRSRNGAYLIHGRSGAGRYLLIVARYRGRGVLRAVTAREMTASEKRLYQKRR